MTLRDHLRTRKALIDALREQCEQTQQMLGLLRDQRAAADHEWRLNRVYEAHLQALQAKNRELADRNDELEADLTAWMEARLP